MNKDERNSPGEVKPWVPGPGDLVNVMTIRQGTVERVKGTRVLVKLGPEENAVVNADELQLITRSDAFTEEDEP